MSSRNASTVLVALGCLLVAVPSAISQSFRVQCPTSTITHPSTLTNVNSEPNYTAPTTQSQGGNGYSVPTANVNGAIKCQQISGGDGYSTMANGTQTFMFSFGPLSGLEDIAKGLPGTEFPSVFNVPYPGTLVPGDPATTDNSNTVTPYLFESNTNYTSNSTTNQPTFNWNGAVGLIGDPDAAPVPDGGVQATATGTIAGGVVDTVTITNGGTKYFGPVTVTIAPPDSRFCNSTTNPCATAIGQATVVNGVITGVDISFAGTGYGFGTTATTVPIAFNAPTIGCANGTLGADNASCIDGHVDPRQIMDVGVMNGNIPAPLMAIDEDDEFFLTLSNVGMIMRPDLFEQHTVHFHGYPNASSFYDGVPDASVAINIGGSFTYYYLAPDAGTYFWHCHITPPEHLQMGMVGQIYVRPRQNRVPVNQNLDAALAVQQADLRTACRRPGDGIAPSVTSAPDILCTNPLPNPATDAAAATVTQQLDTVGSANTNPNYNQAQKYAYNDGDGLTAYDVEYPIQIHGFDPNFHFVGMTFNPEMFVDMKDKFFLLNGRSYPDTVTPGPLTTESSDGRSHFSQPLPSIINIPAGGKALLRISDLDVQEFQTLASLGIPMHVIGYNAKLLRDQEGNNTDYYSNSITLGGGESLDVILDACQVRSTTAPFGCTTPYTTGSVFYLYTPQLDHLANDQENFGGLMTEVHVN
ncbi:MAG TPA: multicopper oxidase domain-containing protein [Acidobacteriaceae bacterium]|nr:multicopper oxidase domain-containing protein [Acidobacteriaceae bacterium]